MYILGISAYYHDSAAALLHDGAVVAAAQEERFSRVKHDARFPKGAVAYCLETAGLTAADLDYVVFYDKPLIKFERLLMTYLGYAPKGIRSFYAQMPSWLKEKMLMRATLRRELGYEGALLFSSHHLSHAAAAFFPSPFDEAAFITVDGVGEWATTAYGVGQGNKVRILREINFPHSLGLLYSAFTYFCGFKVNSGEYKLMGLAPYGEPEYADLIKRELIDIKDDGSYRLNMAYFDYCAGARMTNRRFARLFGGPERKPETPIGEREMNLARSVQAVTEEALLKMARHAHAETGQRRLCLAGGVALNCVANGRLLREGPFEEIWIQPCAGDGGNALGAALFAWRHLLDRPPHPETPRQQSPYLGPAFDNAAIESALEPFGAKYTRLDPGALPGEVAALLADEKVVGWFQGRMEFGPRALGARSILGDPRSRAMQSVLNLKIKFRESFRPFAPSVLREHADDYFDLRGAESPYMLLVADVKPERLRRLGADESAARGFDKLKVPRSEIPAVTHVDNSARVQTVTREQNPRYHALISAFHEGTGCPVIINTSFNVRGEPIVCTPEEAYACFMRTRMDYLCIGDLLLDKEAQPPWHEEVDWREHFELD